MVCPLIASQRHHVARLLLATLPLLLAFAAYGYTLRLPFFVDDGPNLWTTEHLDGIEQWAGTPAFPYYRPAVFTIWKLNDTLYGRFDAPSLHWLNVVSLGVAGVALGQIVRRLLRGQGRGWLGALAGAAFVLFPFSYQAVTLVSAQFHLLLAAGVLLCLALALRWLDGAGGAAVLVACWLSALIGIFSHENGPLLAVLLLGTILVAYPRGARPALRRIVVVAAPVIALSAVYGLLWLVVPRDTSVQADLSPAPEDAFGYLLQGLIYPVSALAQRIFQPESVLPETAIALALGVVALALVALLARGRQAISPGLLGLAWYGAAIAPSALLLAPDYVLGSPRLMMLASAGGALFWAAIGRALWRGRAGCAAVTLARILTLALAITFLWARRDEHLRMGRFTRDLVALGETLPLEQDGVLLVNAPNYIAPAQRTFLLGSEGATFMLDSMSYGQQIWANTGRDHPPVEAITHAATLRYTSGTYQPHGPYLEGEPLDDLLRAAPWIAVTQFSGDKFTPVIVRDPRDLAPAGALARFGEAVTLLDAQASAQLDARALSVRLAWSVQAPAPLKLFVHVWCGDQLVAQSDGYPWGDLYPFAAWQPGEERVERRLIRLPDDVSAACLSVTAGLYHEATLERLPALDPRTSDPLAGETAPVPLDFSG